MPIVPVQPHHISSPLPLRLSTHSFHCNPMIFKLGTRLLIISKIGTFYHNPVSKMMPFLAAQMKGGALRSRLQPLRQGSDPERTTDFRIRG